MPEMSIGRAFGWLADRDPDAVAVRCGDEVLTRRELDRTTNRIARAWVEQGVRRDDRVTVALANGLDPLLAFVAAWKAGATPAPVSPRLSPPEREAIDALVRPALVVDGPVERYAEVSDEPLPDRAASSWKAPTSSGSTGRPKVVLAAAPARVDPEGRVAPFVPRQAVQLVSGPLFHAAPFVYAARGLMTGHELVVMPRFDAEEWLRLVTRHRVTWGMLVPTTMRRIWRSPDRPGADVSSLERVLHLGARCPIGLKEAWIGWLGPDRVDEVYAGTESQGLTHLTGREWLARRGSVGRPISGTELRVVRPDGTDCEPGETGEVLMRRPVATYRYLGAEPHVRYGWHTLGDGGHLDVGGYLHLADRLDDVITTGGVKVQPADVEAVLDAHPQVDSSAVVGRDHADLGQTVHAVVHAPGVDVAALETWVRARLDPERRPRSWLLVDVPLRDETGKVRRGDHRPPPG